MLTSQDLPETGSVAAAIDLSARLRVFDFDGSLASASRDVWTTIEPEIVAVSEAYWQQWLRCFADERDWAPHETAKMIDDDRSVGALPGWLEERLGAGLAGPRSFSLVYT